MLVRWIKLTSSGKQSQPYGKEYAPTSPNPHLPPDIPLSSGMAEITLIIAKSIKFPFNLNCESNVNLIDYARNFIEKSEMILI